jgi:hypothetical protein
MLQSFNDDPNYGINQGLPTKIGIWASFGVFLGLKLEDKVLVKLYFRNSNIKKIHKNCFGSNCIWGENESYISFYM